MAMRLNENLDDNGEMHEINVTPFIDVMLVLLIIFMVAAPLATVDVKVNLPASSSQPQPRPEKPIYLSVKADKSMFLGNDPVTEANMINALDSLTAGKKDTTVFFLSLIHICTARRYGRRRQPRRSRPGAAAGYRYKPDRGSRTAAGRAKT